MLFPKNFIFFQKTASCRALHRRLPMIKSRCDAKRSIFIRRIFDMKELSIGKNDVGQRLDRFVSKSVPLLPASLLQKYIRLKRIKVNGKRAERDTRLCEGDLAPALHQRRIFRHAEAGKRLPHRQPRRSSTSSMRTKTFCWSTKSPGRRSIPTTARNTARR